MKTVVSHDDQDVEGMDSDNEWNLTSEYDNSRSTSPFDRLVIKHNLISSSPKLPSSSSSSNNLSSTATALSMTAAGSLQMLLQASLAQQLQQQASSNKVSVPSHNITIYCCHDKNR